jgi:diguanylate cyclase (GGDEF)-like protein/PAS domain S-box-containing protein
LARLENRHTDRNLTEERFRTLLEHNPDAICVLQDGRLTYVNAAAMRCMRAETRDQMIGHPITDFVDPDAMTAMWVSIAALREVGDASVPLEAQIVRVDGSTSRVEAVAVLTLWEDEPAYQVVWRDVSAHEAARDLPDLTDDRFKVFVELLDDGVVVLRNDGHIKYINPAAMRIIGLGPEHRAGDFARRTASLPIFDADGHPLPPQMRPLTRLFRDRVPFSKQVYGTELPNGQRKWMQASGCLLNPDAPANSDMLFSFSDVTTQRAAVDQLVHQANHDPLTGLPNRGFVLRRIAEALAASDAAPLCAVLFIDLDDLKTTNDTLGHTAGDDLLRAAAARLQQAVDPDDVVGRHGGDEFVVLLFGDATRDELEVLVDRLRIELAKPVDIADTTIPVRASVGLVEVHRDDNRTAEEILREADRAMYKAKRAARSNGRRITD